MNKSNIDKILILILTLFAFGLRVWQLDNVPPGWRDDELINSLVISQKVLDGDWAVFYPDASGHEALYHALNALTLALLGVNVFGIRLLSAILGTLAIPLIWLFGRRLVGRWGALVAAGMLAVSFWSLMYSRFGLRHIQTPFITLLTFYFFWAGLTVSSERKASRYFGMAGVSMAAGFYTYFAARGLPLIWLALMGYVWLAARERWQARWRGMVLGLVVTAVLILPLVITLRQQPEAEGRVTELAIPLVAARQGDFAPLGKHIRITLGMFHANGDDEWLYNIPHRPVFSLPIGVWFWFGVIMAGWQALRPFLQRQSANHTALASALLLIWWLAGISPGFLSVPPASLGHTILAQPAVFMLAGLPITLAHRTNRYFAPLLVSVLILVTGIRDLPDYFTNWPQRGLVRFLYKADIHDVAAYLNTHPELTDFGITGLLAGPWDRLALAVDLHKPTLFRPRWFNPERALLLQPSVSFGGYPDVPFAYEEAFWPLPDVPGTGEYQLSQVTYDLNETAEPTCFTNGLCVVSAVYDTETGFLELGWKVAKPLTLPPMPLISNPPPPGVYAGPRLLVFAQMLDTNGNFLAGDDGLWVDPTTLYPGDLFVQRHHLPVNMDGGMVAYGLYDPMTGERILTKDGRDHLSINLQKEEQ